MARILQSTLFAIAFLFTASTTAQTILLEELFDDSTLGSFTAHSVIGDGQFWQARDFGGKFFAQMNGFDGGIQDNEDWLISPALDMEMYTDEVLTFENAANFDGPDLEVLVSTDYDGTSDPNTATWTDVSAGVTWSPGGFEYVDSGVLDLSSFSGTGYVAFKYISNSMVDGKLWQVDSIVVSANTLTGLEDLEDQSAITNPVVRNGHLEFEVLDRTSEWTFNICSMEGRTMPEHQNMRFTTSDVSIPVMDLPRGVYVLMTRRDAVLKSYKFVR